MSRRYFIIGKISKAADFGEQARESIEQSILAQGATPEQIEQAGALVRRKGIDRSPSAEAGVVAMARHKGEEFQIVGEHTNAHGDKVTEIVRRTEAGRFETVRVREAQADRHTFVVAETRGGY